MKLVFPEISEPISFKENTVNTLVIENPSLFFRLVADIHGQINGSEGKCVLSLDNVPVEMSKNVELISNFVPFELNRKTLLNKLAAVLEKIAVNETYYYRTASLLAEIENYISDISFELPCDVECNGISVATLLKAAGLRVREDGASLPENILNYMELVRELEKDKLFVFINMRSYFGAEELQCFFNSVMSHKYNVLLIDNSDLERLQGEKRVIIDNDLCEI